MKPRTRCIHRRMFQPVWGPLIMPTPIIFINTHFSLILANVNTHLTEPTVFHIMLRFR